MLFSVFFVWFFWGCTDMASSESSPDLQRLSEKLEKVPAVCGIFLVLVAVGMAAITDVLFFAVGSCRSRNSFFSWQL